MGTQVTFRTGGVSLVICCSHSHGPVDAQAGFCYAGNESVMKATKRQLAMLRSLRTRKGRRETGFFLVENLRLCAELRASGLPVELVLIAEHHSKEQRYAELIERFRRAGARVVHAAGHEVQRIADTVHSQGIVAAARWGDHAFENIRFGRRAVAVALDRVADPGNVGTVIRTAAWFGVTAVLLGEGCADLLNPKTVRSTMGGLFHLPVCRNVALPRALDRLKQRGFSVTVAATDGSPGWRSWTARGRSLLVLGSEAHGVSEAVRRLAERTVAIPKRGRGESLNVAVKAGIFLSAGESNP